MRIPIVDNIVMTSDSCNIILNRALIWETGKKKGQRRLAPYAYYPSVVQALEGVFDTKLRESTARSLKTLVREHHDLLKHFTELLGTKFKDK